MARARMSRPKVGGGLSPSSRSHSARSPARDSFSSISRSMFTIGWLSMVGDLSMARRYRREGAPDHAERLIVSRSGARQSYWSCRLAGRLAFARDIFGHDAIDPLHPGLLGHE